MGPIPLVGVLFLMLFGHSIDGGFNTEAGPSAGFPLRGDGLVSVPWLLRAENVIYNLDGWPQKMPGASNVNGTATGASDHVNGVFDYWRSGTGTSQTQQRVIYAGTQIYTESGGTLTSRRTGLESGMMPWFEVMNDVCVIATSSSVDVPMTWNQTTFANLGGSPPAFKFMVQHGNYMFAAGVDANKSRLFYSATENQADWTSASSGSIDVSPDDGDIITGLRSHHGELIILKGPNKGSIFRMTGTAEASWALSLMARGVGGINHQSILLARDDLWFPDDNGIHSLATTANFGDYSQTFLSRDIATYFIKQLNHNRFTHVWGANFTGAGQALWTFSRAGATTNDVILMLDYRFQPMRFALWPAYAVGCLAMVRDTSRETVPWAGTYAGRVLRMNQSARNIAGTAYSQDVLFPYLSYGDPFLDKSPSKGRIGFAPKGDTTFTFGYQRDGNTQQTESITQSGTASLGASSNQFVLDTSALGGGRFQNAFFDMRGQFKEVQYQMTQGGNDVDCEPHSLAVDIEGAGIGTRVTDG